MPPTMKLQIGFFLPQIAMQRVDAMTLEVKRKAMGADMRAVPATDLSVNLFNLGETEVSKVKSVETTLANGCSRVPSFSCGLGGLIGLPNPTQPKFCAIQLEGNVDFLVKLQGMLDVALRGFVGNAEVNKEWQPSVVITRLRTDSEQARSNLGRAIKSIATPSEAVLFPVTQLHLIETVMDATSARLVSRTAFDLVPAPK